MSAQWVMGPSSVMAFVVGLCLVIYYLMPRFTRPDLYFAVTVLPEFRDSEEAWSILKRYRVQVVISSVLALVVILAGARITSPDYQIAIMLGGLLMQGVGVFLAYYRARRQVLPHAVAPATVREAALVPRQVRLPGGWLLQIPPFAILAGTGIWLYAHWAEIPETFPIHWGANGQPNNWATRSFGGVYWGLVMGAITCALMGFLAYSFLRWSRPIRAGGAAGERERRFRVIVASILVAVEYFLAVEFMWVGLTPLSHPQAGPPALGPMLAFVLVFAAVVVVLLLRYGQGGTRLAREAVLTSRAAPPIGDSTPDRYWKLGLFYVNRDDPALFVEKRFGIGYTINFGHRGVWIFLVVLLAVTLGAFLFAPSQHRP